MLIYIVAIIIVIVVLCIYTTMLPLPGKLNKDGSEVYLGGGKWDDASYSADGKEYLNPLTKETEQIPGAINYDNTTVYNGTTWEPVTFSLDGKSYLNPVTFKYAPVELVRTDKSGRIWQWNLFTSKWFEVEDAE